MISLLTTAFSCIFYGIALTGLVMAILYVGLKSIGESVVQGVVFWLTGIILSFLLIFQFTLLIGAVKAKSCVDDIEHLACVYTQDVAEINGREDVYRYIDKVSEEYPWVQLCSEHLNVSAVEPITISDLSRSLESFLVGYIWRRIGWILGFVILGCALPLFLGGGSYRAGSDSYGGVGESSDTHLQF